MYIFNRLFLEWGKESGNFFNNLKYILREFSGFLNWFLVFKFDNLLFIWEIFK